MAGNGLPMATPTVIRHDGLQARLGLTQHRHGSQEAFDETHSGLDHVTFTVADHEELETWVARLADAAVVHSPIAAANSVPAASNPGHTRPTRSISRPRRRTRGRDRRHIGRSVSNYFRQGTYPCAGFVPRPQWTSYPAFSARSSKRLVMRASAWASLAVETASGKTQADAHTCRNGDAFRESPMRFVMTYGW